MKSNTFKKVFCGVVAFVCAALCAPATLFSANANTAEKETLNVYLIAGQSNAAGYSGNAYLTCSDTKVAEYRAGYSNVWYHGNADNNFITAYDQVAKLGQGKTDSNFGAEVGMAEIISQNDPNQQSVIIKHGVGGTYLIDNQTHDVSVQNGNWCPPSMRTDAAAENLTGKLYNEFVALVEESVEYYQTAGYEVNLCGTFWMQGEAENGAVTADVYATHLKALINDLRADFADVFDNDVEKAPFIIGKIAPTFAGGGAGIEAIRMGQDLVASVTGEYAVANAYTVETEDYIIVDPATNQPADGCYDRYHFSADDMISLGHDVAIAALNYGRPFASVQLVGEGNVDKTYAALTDGPVTFTFTPAANYTLKKLTKNGVDVTADVVNNTYTVTETTGKVLLIAEFEEADKFALKVDCDRNGATVSRNIVSAKYYVGQELNLKVTLKNDYTLESVTFNGQKVTADANGRYKIVIAAGENVFKVVLKAPVVVEDEFEGDSSNEQQDENNGDNTQTGMNCKSTVGGVGVVACLGMAMGVLLAKKNERD